MSDNKETKQTEKKEKSTYDFSSYKTAKVKKTGETVYLRWSKKADKFRNRLNPKETYSAFELDFGSKKD